MRFISGLSLILLACAAVAQPRLTDEGVSFHFTDNSAKSVSLVGDFNAWSKNDHPMSKGPDGVWTFTRRISPGSYQYKFLVDGEHYVNDPGNPAMVDNYNQSGKNSVFVLTQENKIALTDKPPRPASNPNDTYPATPDKKPVYLNIIWHQHQPLYVDPGTDQLQGPWVRTHATKDYYDMAAMLGQFPDIHCNINLTSSLLHQLREYYVKRLEPFVDTKNSRVDVNGLWKQWKGRTDPWIDLALKPTSEFTKEDKDHLYRNVWNAFGISEVMIERFPEYAALKKKLDVDQMPGGDLFNEQQMREIKFFFYAAYFDPDFFVGPIRLADGSTCDLSDLIGFRSGKYYLRRNIEEADCNRIVAEAYKVMANIIPVHKELMYTSKTNKGQIEVITTPYYHPILPLIYDSGLAKICQPDDRHPSRYSFPTDANAQIVKAVMMYTEVFDRAPTGMWPGEGSIAQQVLSLLRKNGILWTASDVRVLKKSTPQDQPNTSAYRFPTGDGAASMALVFRDTELSDRIGFKYQTYKGEEAAEDFIQSILTFAPSRNEDDVLITVILDGENAWEWYREDIDGKQFLNALYRKLSRLYESKQIVTTTMTEYLTGNKSRGITPHPVESLPAIKQLWPGSWINGNYDTWIGEEEENVAWEYLLRARTDLEKSGIKQPDPRRAAPKSGSKEYYPYQAWEAMYAAEGSDWFWWYGTDQSAPAGDEPFDIAFRTHLENMYKFAGLAGSTILSPGFDPILKAGNSSAGGQGTMAKSTDEEVRVVFVCDARKEKISTVFIVGNAKQLGEWTPNVIAMYDDGTHGDATAGDNLWSLELRLPAGEQVQYKYTNSGKKGEWVPSEEFAQHNRVYVVTGGGTQTVTDVFGQ